MEEVKLQLYPYSKMSKGYNTICRYSETEVSDDMGRWSRDIIYNGLNIANIGGFYKKGAELEGKKPNTIPDYFFAHLFFPTGSNQSNASKGFDTYEQAYHYVENMFELFRKHIKK